MGALQLGALRRAESIVMVLVAFGATGCVGDFLSGPGHRTYQSSQPRALLVLNPESVSLGSLGDSALYQASWWTNGNLTAATGCTWSVSDGTVATADTGGAIIATGNGSATVSATCGDTTATAAVGVWQQVASVVMSPRQIELHLGQTTAVQVEARDARGNYLARPLSFSWTSSNELVANVQRDAQDPSRALVTRYFPGSAQIIATAEGATATANVK